MTAATASAVHDLVTVASLVAGSALLLLLPPVTTAASQTALATDWALSLNDRTDEILAELDGPPVAALCTTPNRAVYTFTWTTGEGTCEEANNATAAKLPVGSAPHPTMYPQQTGYSAALQVPVAGLAVARYYFVKCSATKPSSTVSQCAQFRLYGRIRASGSLNLDALAQGDDVSLPCDTVTLPDGVDVSVAWMRDGKPMPAQQQRTSIAVGSAKATRIVASSLKLRNTPDAGGLYTCDVNSSAYGKLVTLSVTVFRAAVAVFVALDERPDNGSPGAGRKLTIRVSATCEGYGYPLPIVSLVKDQFTFSGNGSSQPLDGGIRTTYVFFQSSVDDSSEVSSYGCRAENSRGASNAYYCPLATASSTVKLSNAPCPAGSSGAATWLRQLPPSWLLLALLTGFIFFSACLS